MDHDSLIGIIVSSLFKSMSKFYIKYGHNIIKQHEEVLEVPIAVISARGVTIANPDVTASKGDKINPLPEFEDKVYQYRDAKAKHIQDIEYIRQHLVYMIKKYGVDSLSVLPKELQAVIPIYSSYVGDTAPFNKEEVEKYYAGFSDKVDFFLNSSIVYG